MVMINPNWNSGIARLLPHNYQAADRAYCELTDRWPQINRRTKVSLTGSRHIVVNDSAYVPPSLPGIRKRVAVSGWSRLRAMASTFDLQQLDDPNTRATYHAGLIYAILHVPVYAFWRVAGRLLEREVWVKWGTELVWENDIPASAPMAHQRVIQLEPLGIYWQELGGWTNQFYLLCAYDPLTDTFFVRE